MNKWPYARAAALAAAGIAAAVAAAETLNVQVREAPLRASASMLAPPVATAKYGDAVTVEQRTAGWARVKTAAGASGWVHESALTKKRIQLQAGEQTVAGGASVQEVALAGKGFSEEVEKEYRKENKTADYAWVDRLEKMAVSPDRIAAFLREGGVAAPGGAQ